MIHNGFGAVMFPDTSDEAATMGNATRAAILCAALLSACSTVRPHATQGYRDGYITGCSSGQVYAGKSGPEAPRDNARYGTDAEYTRGWNDGQQECYTQAMASPRGWGGSGGR
jgi:hypothetical protein